MTEPTPAGVTGERGPEPTLPDRADAVTVAYVHNSANPAGHSYSWHHSLTQLLGYDMANAARVMRGGYVAMHCGTGGLVQARNQGVVEFLANRDADWLLWVDTDMGFAPDTVDRLLAVADPDDRPIVGALCFSQREGEQDGMGGFRTRATPTLFRWAHIGDQQGFLPILDYERDAVVQVAGTGAACILIHRSALEKIHAEFGTWYDRLPNPSIGELTSEDLSFCMRASALSIPIFVHTGVRTTHHKTQWVSEQVFDEQTPAPPAAQEVAVIVPVLGRPQNAEPFMRSLRASTGLATAYAIAQDDDPDTAQAWKAAGAQVITTDRVTFAEKVNIGYAATGQPWIFITGDDVKFWPGWLDRALWGTRTHHGVVGTNDLANPRVVAGQHATHVLIRRTYIDEIGASWDGPGVVCHEGYRHWYVDDEIAAAAQQRGTWRMALGSVVEHLHPIAGKADDDDIYRLGQSFADTDRATFERRLAAHG